MFPDVDLRARLRLDEHVRCAPVEFPGGIPKVKRTYQPIAAAHSGRRGQEEARAAMSLAG